ncbi:MAG TPA: AMP-binding protein [Streptosporangiaceae bacterium]|nr:AMP-binding protein [Streptosporangiaceae bacterium]
MGAMETRERDYTSAYTFLRMWRRRHRPYGRGMQHGSRQPFAGPAAGPVPAGSTVTAAVFGAVAGHAEGGPGRADRPALIDTADDRALSYAEFAAVVPAAAAGLARRGVRTGDVAAVYVSCTRQLALAVHAFTAAGAVPMPIPRAGITSADELAAVLTAYQARMLITAPPLGGLALDATDRSYVRQVFAFGDVPGATPFGELLRGGGPAPRIDPERDHALIQPRLASGKSARAAESGGAGGAAGDAGGTAEGAGRERLTHADRLAHLDRLAAALPIERGEVLVGVSTGCPTATWVGLIDVALLSGATFVAVTRPGPARLPRAIETYDAALAVVAPVTLRALAREEVGPPRPGRPARLLVTGPAPEDVVLACRRHGWSVEILG